MSKNIVDKVADEDNVVPADGTISAQERTTMTGSGISEGASNAPYNTEQQPLATPVVDPSLSQEARVEQPQHIGVDTSGTEVSRGRQCSMRNVT